MGPDHGQDWGSDSGQSASVSGTASGGAGGFDGYDVIDVPLGDLMRGERATLGKSLLDVERELKIRAAYIAAIENGDVGAFSASGFIAGYVRSYARYLGMEPEWTFRRFCEETGFQGVHGQSARQAQEAKRSFADAPPRRMDPNDVMSSARISLAPARESWFSGIEPGALGSAAMLLVLVAGLGYGAWAVLTDIQRLQIAPVDEAPATMAELDPLAGATEGAFDVAQEFDIDVPGSEALERLYRPQALEAPVMTPRDGALATLDPDRVGALAGAGTPNASRAAPRLEMGGGPAAAPALGAAPEADPTGQEAPAVQVTEATGRDDLVIFAVRPTWVRVSSAAGAVLWEGTLDRGDSYTIPRTNEPPRLRSGNAGSLYFALNGVTMGPAGEGASIVRDVELSADAIQSSYAMADAEADPDLPEVAALILGQSDAE
jgi:cytoskeletal protein RodZ